MRYFRMRDDVDIPKRWFLTDPVDSAGRSLDWAFSSGTNVQAQGPVRLSHSKNVEHGRPVDYSELAMESVPVVHARVAHQLVELAPSDVQVVPVVIDGCFDQFVIVNVVQVVKCIDEEASGQIVRYTQADARLYPERMGQYKAVAGLRIDKSMPGGAKIFRLWGWPVAIVVSDEVRQALARIGTAGVRFEEV